MNMGFYLNGRFVFWGEVRELEECQVRGLIPLISREKWTFYSSIKYRLSSKAVLSIELSVIMGICSICAVQYGSH